MLKLMRPSLELKKMYDDYINEWQENGERIVPASSCANDISYEDWLKRTYAIEGKDTCPSELVPAYTYFLVEDDNKIIGAVNIRYELNEYLFLYGGHIGYGIRKSERRKGYAKILLEMALIEAAKLGLDKVLVTCDKENTGSARTIQKNGGILENEINEGGKLVQRYWIEIK